LRQGEIQLHAQEIEKQWWTLSGGYQNTVKSLRDSGPRCQCYVDTSWTQLEDFVKLHPAYAEKLAGANLSHVTLL